MSNSNRPSLNKQAHWSIPILFFSGIVILITTIILILNNGKFTYIIDDTYIHLALAENIARGHYGVNLTELSAPSSSILWPFLLTPLALTSVGELIPLLIAFIASLFTIYLFCITLLKIAKNHFTTEIPRSVSYGIIAIGCIMPIWVNLAGMTFNGMEHALQALCSIAVVSAFIFKMEGEMFPWWGVAAIILGPLVRYENTALSLLAIFVLFFHGRRKTALVSLLIIIISLLSFSLFLKGLDLGYFPSSILAKSRLEGRGAFPISIFYSFAGNVTQRQGPILIAALALILLKVRYKTNREIIFIVAGAVLAHFAVGDVMGRRYTVYMAVMMILTIIYLYRETIGSFFVHGSRKAKLAVISTVSIVTCALLVVETARTPIAANNIYEQQYQMHRLAKLYGKPVAINDLGFVSFRNDAYVLDLWGLASLKALKLRTEAISPEWPDILCAEYNAELIMVYDDWFQNKPANWVKIGDITLSRRRVAPAGATVSFYASSPGSKSELLQVLKSFNTQLPERVTMNIYF